MTHDATSRRSRRALLGGAIGAMAAVAAQAIGRPIPATAGHTPVYIDESNTSYGTSTSISRGDVRSGASFATSNYGVVGYGARDDTIGVLGHAAGGVRATAVKGATDGYNYQVAVHADTTDGYGEGIAVNAETKNGIAVKASATGGAALVVSGLTQFSRSGRTSFAAGQANLTLKAGRITPDTLVIATVQGGVSGVWVLGVSVNVSKQQFTIRLNRAAPRLLVVGWFVVN